MPHIDGFVMAVPTANKQQFIDYARAVDPVFLEYGATRVLECWQDDVPHGKQTDFYRAVDAREDEAIVFAWVEWPDKATRDAAMEKMMADPRMDPKNPDNPPVPYDGMRMIYGSFTPVLELVAGG